MGNNDKKQNSGWGLFITVIITVLILAAAPVYQTWLASLFITDVEQFREYLKSSDRDFYQFLFTAFGVLAAVAGYLTYKSRQEAKQEMEELKKQLEDKKQEIEGKIIQIENEVNAKKEAMDRYCDQIKQSLEQIMNEFIKKAGEKEKLIDQAAAKVATTAEQKMAEITGIQLPTPRDTESQKQAKELFNNGVGAYQAGELERAIDFWTRAIQIKPDYEVIYYNRGVARVKKGDHDGAIEDFTRAIQIKPDYEAAYSNRGFARRKKGDHDGAIEDYTRAIQIKPDYADAYYNRGFARVKKGDLDGALEDYTRAIQIKPDDAAAYYNLACLWSIKGDVGKCASFLRRAIELDVKYLEMARKDKDFEAVRNDKAIAEILGKPPGNSVTPS